MQASDETASQDEDSSERLGDRLRQAREDQDLSLEAVSAELRIEVPMLRALEEERFDALSAPVFAKGFLKQYGARLGLDTAELIDLYESATVEVPIDIAPSKTIRLRDDRQVTFLVIAAIALVIVAATLAVWWWLGSDAADNLISDSVLPSTILQEPEPELGTEDSVRPAIQPPAESEAGDDPAIDSEATQPAAAQPAEASAIGDATAVDDSSEDVAVDAESESGITADPVYSGPELLIVFNEDSWTEVSDESGEQLFYALGRAGSSALIPADRRLNLLFGNADGIELSLGGEPVEIPDSARRRGNLAQFDFDPEAGRSQ